MIGVKHADTNERVQRVRQPRWQGALSPERGTEAPRGTVPEAIEAESEPARAEAQAPERQDFLGFGPRFRVLVDGRFSHLAGDLGEGETASGDSGCQSVEAVTVSHILPVVVAESLFIDVPEQVEGFHAYVGTTQTTLQQAPEVLQPVGMDIPLDVGFGVVDELVDVVGLQPKVGDCLIAEDVRARFNVLFDVASQIPSVVRPGENLGTNLASSLQDSLNASLTGSASTFALERPLLPVLVYIPSLAADVGLIDLDLSREHGSAFVLHGKSNPVEHEPSGLLGDADSAVEFVGTDAVLAVGNHPHGGKPLVQPDGGIFKDGSDLDGELGLGVPSLALPDAPGLQIGHLLRSASWTANDAVLPTLCGEEVNAVVGVREVNYRFLKGFWFGFHDSIITEVV